MKIKIELATSYGEIETDEISLVSLPARPEKREVQTRLELWDLHDKCTYEIGLIHTGDLDSSNALCEEIAKRWNEYPKLIKELENLNQQNNEK